MHNAHIGLTDTPRIDPALTPDLAAELLPDGFTLDPTAGRLHVYGRSGELRAVIEDYRLGVFRAVLVPCDPGARAEIVEVLSAADRVTGSYLIKRFRLYLTGRTRSQTGKRAAA